MDYKTNILTTEIDTGNDLYPEIQGLHFGVLGDDYYLFDATAYIEENELEQIDYKAFIRANKHYIENIAKKNNIKTSELFYQNRNGHILIAHDLVFLYTSFVNPELCIYFCNLLSDLMSVGVAYSDSFAYNLASDRLPKDILEEIIQNQQEESDEEEDRQHTDDGGGVQ